MPTETWHESVLLVACIAMPIVGAAPLITLIAIALTEQSGTIRRIWDEYCD